MSKLPPPGFDDDLPPPYTPTAPDHGLFTSHLYGIHSQVQSSDAGDNQILATLVDPVESFLASIANIRPAPKLVEAAFVPEEALGPGWKLTNEGDRHKGEVTRVMRVRRSMKGGMDRKDKHSENQGSAGEERGFADWGRFDDEVSSNPDDEAALWWSDEDLARRLARHLQPASPQALPNRSQEASMTVHADEVTFRRENEMGIWESKTGWGIVVQVSLRN